MRDLRAVKGDKSSMLAYLVLEDGTVFQGKGFGCTGMQSGEVVFHTGMTGYQKILTDPSYNGQIVVLTYPLVGNYGINPDEFESEKSQVRGLVIKELCEYPSNWRAVMKLEDFCARYGIPGISGIDTRALTRHLRCFGTMRGVLAIGEQDPALLVRTARKESSKEDLVRNVTTKNVQIRKGDPIRIVVVDLGSKIKILRFLAQQHCTVYLAPAWTTAEEIMSYQPHGVILSDGPGDPRNVMYAVETTRRLLGGLPLMGISLGHQVLGLALGGEIYKLKFGHRGYNQPVKDYEMDRVYITSQNHGYAVNERNLPADEVVVSHRNLNDGTVEGLKHLKLPVFSIQFLPDEAACPDGSFYLLERFMNYVKHPTSHGGLSAST